MGRKASNSMENERRKERTSESRSRSEKDGRDQETMKHYFESSRTGRNISEEGTVERNERRRAAGEKEEVGSEDEEGRRIKEEELQRAEEEGELVHVTRERLFLRNTDSNIGITREKRRARRNSKKEIRTSRKGVRRKNGKKCEEARAGTIDEEFCLFSSLEIVHNVMTSTWRRYFHPYFVFLVSSFLSLVKKDDSSLSNVSCKLCPSRHFSSGVDEESLVPRASSWFFHRQSPFSYVTAEVECFQKEGKSNNDVHDDEEKKQRRKEKQGATTDAFNTTCKESKKILAKNRMKELKEEDVQKGIGFKCRDEQKKKERRNPFSAKRDKQEEREVIEVKEQNEKRKKQLHAKNCHLDLKEEKYCYIYPLASKKVSILLVQMGEKRANEGHKKEGKKKKEEEEGESEEERRLEPAEERKPEEEKTPSLNYSSDRVSCPLKSSFKSVTDQLHHHVRNCRQNHPSTNTIVTNGDWSSNDCHQNVTFWDQRHQTCISSQDSNVNCSLQQNAVAFINYEQASYNEHCSCDQEEKQEENVVQMTRNISLDDRLGGRIICSHINCDPIGECRPPRRRKLRHVFGSSSSSSSFSSSSFLINIMFLVLMLHYHFFNHKHNDLDDNNDDYGHDTSSSNKFPFLFPTASALGTNCKCVHFDDSYSRPSYNRPGKDFGSFNSPNWPETYDSGIDCLLYTFKGPPNHLVQLTFNHFNLQRVPSSPKSYSRHSPTTKANHVEGCSSGDYIKLYLDLDGVEEEENANERGKGNEEEKDGNIDDYEQYGEGSHLRQDPSFSNGVTDTARRKDEENKDEDKGRKMEGNYLMKHSNEKGRKEEKTGVINELAAFSKIICGKSLPQSQKVHYSLNSVLVLEFHSMDFHELFNKVHHQIHESENTGHDESEDQVANVTSTSGSNGGPFGFSGVYQFMNKSNFAPDGDSLPGTSCDYEFLSIPTTATLSGERPKPKSQGKFFSPGFPSSFAHNLKCAYHFMAKFSEKIRVTFDKVDLSSEDSSCMDSPDLITVFDGRNDQSPIIAQICNNRRPIHVISTGPDLYIEFTSGSLPSPSIYVNRDRKVNSGQGFRAFFKFFQDPSRIPNLPSRVLSSRTSTPIPDESFPKLSSDGDDTRKMYKQATQLMQSFDCSQNLSSDGKKNGIFQSPNYPISYPPQVVCNFRFSGSGRERIQISFIDFDLFVHPDDISPRDCEEADSLLVLVDINGNKERIDNFCGTKTPLQVMSNGPTLNVQFISTKHHPSLVTSSNPSSSWSLNGHYVNQNFRGFRASYKFLTDFGVAGNGVQDPKLGVCAFVYKSEVKKNGTFTSPNWPGLYPRETECHYFFYGQSSERVHIQFLHFDVEGVPPCTHQSASDYVEFSNYQTVDRKLPRNCGIRKPSKISSDSEFFRIIFKSNDKFDGTGFEAFYQFEVNPTDEKSIASRMPKETPTSSSTAPTQFYFSSLSLLISFQALFSQFI